MKRLVCLGIAVASLSLLGLVGCNKEGGIDTAKVESAFQTASTVDKTEAQNAVTAIKAGDYNAAMASLQKAAASAKLTPEQKSALDELITQLKAKAGEAAKKAVEDASKAVKDAGSKAAGDLQKAVGK